MNIIDACIILFLLLGCVIGFKKGFIKSLVTLIGTMLVVVISYKLKSPLATLLLKYMPFFNFSGIFEGCSALNILIYEAIAFLLIFIILSCILGIIINISGIVEKILNATIVLGLFSKILGAIAGLLEMLAFVFVALFVLVQFNATSELVLESKVGLVILNGTPILKDVCSPMIKSIETMYELVKDDTKTKDEINYAAVEELNKTGVISNSDLEMLRKIGKIDIGDNVILSF